MEENRIFIPFYGERKKENHLGNPKNLRNTFTKSILIPRYFNLSDTSFSCKDIELLNKGINFIPSNSKIDTNKIDNAFFKFVRLIKLKDFFGDDKAEQIRFRPPSKWEPESAMLSPHAQNLIDKTHRSFYGIMDKYTFRNKTGTSNFYKTLNVKNLDDYGSIDRIAKNDKITIRKADKGASFVILNTTEYLSEVYQQLSNCKFYKKLEEPLHPINEKHLQKITYRAFRQGIINYKTYKFLENDENYKTRKFYVLPKIHKPVSKWKNPKCPPGRPIVSDVQTESSRIAEFIDFYVNKHSRNLPSYVKDSFDFVQKIKNTHLDENDIFITGDINSLYTNMNLNRTVAVTKRLFKRFPESNRPDKLIIDLLDYTLKHNDFEFNGEFFLQICGCAMGKKYSPGLANLYLESLDKFILNYKIKPKIYLRYLDDIFLIWDGNSKGDLQLFENEINNVITDIKIELNSDESSIDFLDVTVLKECDGSIGTKVFFKETNNRLLLNPTSCHPKHTFSGILKSQFIRYKRLSSKREYFIKTSNELIKRQLQLGYNLKKMKAILRQVASSKQDNEPNKINKEILPFVIPFSKTAKLAVRKVQNLFSTDSVFNKFKVVAAFKKEQNLKSRFF